MAGDETFARPYPPAAQKPYARMSRDRLRALARSIGYDVIRYPNPSGSLGPHLLTLLERTRIDCILDVGAHWGAYGTLVRKAGYREEIVSFEPVSTSASKLQERVDMDPRWSMHRVALGSHNGREEINVLRESDLASFLTTTDYGESHFPEATVLERRETVDIRRLDSLLDDCVRRASERRFFLKMDTQGWDLEVLQGAAGYHDRIFGLQSELSVKPLYEGMPSYFDALGRFQELGFEPTGMFPVTRDRYLRVVEFDCVMTKAGAWQ
jgi:FkbM family methyltransferase